MTASAQYSWEVILEGVSGFLILYALFLFGFSALTRRRRRRLK